MSPCFVSVHRRQWRDDVIETASAIDLAASREE
jgi:hypothetical protein